MYRIFQTFIDRLASAQTPQDFSDAMATTAGALDLSCFAYLALPHKFDERPRLISTYPSTWTSKYLSRKYERVDPVIKTALQKPEPFEWGIDLLATNCSLKEQQLLEEAAQFGIRFGFTVPIHDGHGPVAAVTFAADQRREPFDHCIKSNARALQLMAMYFHAHVRRKLVTETMVDGIALSRRELECLEWASQGKSAWEIGCILGISRNTVAYYLENAKQKLGVRTLVQAVMRVAAASKEKRN
ncbi:helix-turn-helix transcriptional regulator [Bradyrhizobium sp.]|uniref:helix-turn-helix transcriptional regulator n=1 Tax=Bradyrhizobium sp. TaxID=376 RepID=UPI0039E6611E